MNTPASIRGHPLHPILVTIPIGLFIFSLAADIINLGRLAAGPWADIAFFTMAGGIAGALLAAVPGFIDLMSVTDAKLKRIGITHMTMNLVVVALYVVNWILRYKQTANATLPFILSIIGLVLLCISGWLGATLVHRYRMSVEEPGTARNPLPAT